MLNSILTFIITTLIGIAIGYIGKTLLNFKTQKSALISLLRSEMTDVYYEYKEQQKIPIYKKESWDRNYDTYKSIGGNSFIMDLKNEIDKWEVIA